MEDTSRNSSNQQRGRLWPGSEDLEQDVDDIFLSHKDGDKKIGDNSVGNLSGVRLVRRRETDEDRHVRREGYAEKSTVDREEHIAQVTNRLGMFLFNVFLVQVAFPVETALFSPGDIGRTTGDCGWKRYSRLLHDELLLDDKHLVKPGGSSENGGGR